MCSDTKKSESIGDTHKIRTPIRESGDGQVINYYITKEGITYDIDIGTIAKTI